MESEFNRVEKKANQDQDEVSPENLKNNTPDRKHSRIASMLLAGVMLLSPEARAERARADGIAKSEARKAAMALAEGGHEKSPVFDEGAKLAGQEGQKDITSTSEGMAKNYNPDLEVDRAERVGGDEPDSYRYDDYESPKDGVAPEKEQKPDSVTIPNVPYKEMSIDEQEAFRAEVLRNVELDFSNRLLALETLRTKALETFEQNVKEPKASDVIKSFHVHGNLQHFLRERRKILDSDKKIEEFAKYQDVDSPSESEFEEIKLARKKAQDYLTERDHMMESTAETTVPYVKYFELGYDDREVILEKLDSLEEGDINVGPYSKAMSKLDFSKSEAFNILKKESSDPVKFENNLLNLPMHEKAKMLREAGFELSDLELESIFFEGTEAEMTGSEEMWAKSNQAQYLEKMIEKGASEEFFTGEKLEYLYGNSSILPHVFDRIVGKYHLINSKR